MTEVVPKEKILIRKVDGSKHVITTTSEMKEIYHASIVIVFDSERNKLKVVKDRYNDPELIKNCLKLYYGIDCSIISDNELHLTDKSAMMLTLLL